MRPIELTMSAFGPYADTAKVDFTKIGQSGIYLITGDTGAGKTPICDAIASAFFGHSTGNARNAKSLRCYSADPSAETSVELKFSYRDGIYRIWRCPAYERAKKRGTGTTLQGAEARLECPGKPPITRLRDVDDAIVELLGIDRHQFAQIVMIAQGDFRKLLSAGTDERSRIFRKLFDTDRFLSFQQHLAEEKRTLENRHRAIAQEMRIHAGSIALEQDAPEATEIENRLDADTLQPAWLQNTLCDIVSRDKKRLEAVSARLIEAQARKDAAMRAEENCRHASELRQALARAKDDEARIESAVVRAKAAIEARAPLKEERDRTNERMVVEQNALGSYDEYERLAERAENARENAAHAGGRARSLARSEEKNRTELHRAEEAIERLGRAEESCANARFEEKNAADSLKRIEDYEKAWTAMQATERKAREAQDEAHAAEERRMRASARIDAATALRSKLIAAPEQIARCEATVRQAAERIDRLEDAARREKKAAAACADAQSRAHEAIESYNKKKNEADDAHRLWKHAHDAYLDGQAGLLASSLEKHRPCPVCGSTEHPAPAALAFDTPTKEEVDRLQATWNRAAMQAEEAARLASSEKAGFDEKKRAHADIVEKEGSSERILHALEQARADERSAREALSTATAQARKLEDAEEQLAQALKEREAAENSARARLAASGEACAEAERYDAMAHSERDAIPYENAEALSIARAQAASALQSATSARMQAERDVAALAQARADKKRLGEAVETARAELGKAEQELARLLEQANGAQAAADEMRSRLKYESKNEAMASIAALERRIAAIDATLSKAQDDFEKNEKALASAIGTKEAIERSLAGMPAYDASAIAEEKQCAVDELEELQGKRDALNTRLTNNASTLRSVDALVATTGDIDTRYGELAVLSDTANGRLLGKDKVSFETYVQSIYFDRVIAAANRRLRAMTNGRYELSRQRTALTKTGQSGLDLDVFDAYTGKTRDASSLSGGESFKASLALALGLSDIVQSHAGGIRLDTMFIDEGFGSLDRESLQLAVKTLTELSGNDKLVGIISHVEELKEGIDRKIVVTRGRNGSSLRIEA
ncbi:MAG: SMC family ATPase [Slackia sp.]|nr:SMC family ATPase [Slackia sp.]